jgi:4-hydroxy-3-polyprenylbenzoate decarboxylase
MAAVLGFGHPDELSGLMERLLAELPGTTSAEKLRSLAGSESWRMASPRQLHEAACLEVSGPFDLNSLPFPKNWPGDGAPDHAGRFITLPLVITRDPDDSTPNCGMYRAAILGPDSLAIHWGAESGAAAHARAWAARGERMPVVIAVGGDPAITFAATLPLPLEEFTLAGLLRGAPVTLADSGHAGLPVPAGAELVFHGFWEPGAVVSGGAFGNHTGYYTPAEPAPCIRLTGMTRRRDPIVPATLVGPPPQEDCWFGRGWERLLEPLLRVDLPEIVAIHRPFSGIFHGATVVAVKTDGPEGKDILRRLRATPWLGKARLLVLVDAEQEPAEMDGVLWRLMNNADWQHDLVVDGERLGIDATRYSRRSAGREPLVVTDEISRLVERRWREYGFD